MANPIAGAWSAGQFWGWGLGGAVGCAIPGLPQAVVLAAPGIISANTVIWASLLLLPLGGLAGGGLGYEFSYLMDDPASNRRAIRSAVLFSLAFSMLIYSLLSFPTLYFISAGVPNRIYLLPVIAFVASLIAGCLKGVLNNLRAEADLPFADRV